MLFRAHTCLGALVFVTSAWCFCQAPKAAAERAPDVLKASIAADTRAIRRDVPLTKAIRKAMEAGVRDFTGKPGPDYWQLEVDYDIDVRLDRKNLGLVGSEKVTIHNTSPDSLNRIVLRLDHNIFRPRVPRGSSVPAETTEGMVITRLVVGGEPVDLTPPPGRRRFGRGDRDAPRKTYVRGLDQTVATISLAKPIPARSKAVIEIDWTTRLPGGPDGRGHRMTQRWGDTLFQPTQWFPRVAKYDDLRGWNTSVYLGPAEFFNNFGRFDVRINVPTGWIVTGTGLLQNPEEVLTETARERLARALTTDEETVIVGPDETGPGKSTLPGDRLTWHFHADKVNDFAWATAQNYVWRAARARIPGRGYIPIHMVHLPERANRYERAAALTRHALEYYSELLAPYPFPQITLQDGPSAGMEYPMVINSNQGAADHETAHQWWPMMVGNNETWYGWMDEGFNSYVNVLSRAHRTGRKASFDGRGQSYGRTSGDESEPTMMWSANYAGPMYGFQTYVKTSMMLSMLGGIVGDEKVQEALSAFTRTWAFKHPSPWDFAFFMSNHLGEDFGWLWYSWLWTTESVDGSIAKVEEVDGKTRVTIRQEGQMPSPIVLRIKLAGDGTSIDVPPNGKVIDHRTIELTWPTKIWFDGDKEFAVDLDYGEIASLTLDPYGRFPDKNTDDNTWPRK